MEQKHNSGFTLVELMLVVVIIGVLASIAYPSYIKNAQATRRTTAQADLVELASFLERRFTENNSYLIPNGSTDPISSVVCGTPAGCTPSLNNGITHDDYNYSFSASSQFAFTLRAIPQGEQTNDTCGTMTLAATGAKTASGSGACWK